MIHLKRKGIKKEPAEYVKSRMESQGLNQVELAKLTGMRQDHISRIIRCENKPSLQDFVTFTEVLDPGLARVLANRIGLKLEYGK